MRFIKIEGSGGVEVTVDAYQVEAIHRVKRASHLPQNPDMLTIYLKSGQAFDVTIFASTGDIDKFVSEVTSGKNNNHNMVDDGE